MDSDSTLLLNPRTSDDSLAGTFRARGETDWASPWRSVINLWSDLSSNASQSELSCRILHQSVGSASVYFYQTFIPVPAAISPLSWPKLIRILDEMKTLSEGWDTYSAPPPNKRSLAHAREILLLLQENAMPPYRIDPSVEGGVAFSFGGPERRGIIECDNDGDVVAGVSPKGGRSDFWSSGLEPSELKEAIERIRVFLDARAPT